MHKEQFTEGTTNYSRVRLLVSYCLERDTFQRSTKTALVVGTTLALINHGQQIFTAQFALTWFLPTAITYLVPFSVATYGQIQGKRQRDRLQEEALASRSVRDPFLVPHTFRQQEPEQPSHFSISRPSFFLTSPSVDFGGPAQPVALRPEEDMWQLPIRQGTPSRHLQITPRFTLPMKPHTTRGSFIPAPFPDYASSILREEDHIYQGAG